MNQPRQLIQVLQEYSIPLIIGVVAGLVVANVDHHYYEKLVDYRVFGSGIEVFGRPVTAHFLINDIFMVFFFGIAAKEITQSVLPGGALNPIPRAINPLAGTLGGVLGPVVLYFLLAWVFYGGTDDFSVVANGWGIPTATDIALAWLVARLAFGNGHPAVNFLLLLAVADDAIGLGIIAVFYPDPEHPVQPAWLLLTVAGMATAYVFRRSNLNYWPAYILIAGGLSWAGLAKSSIEPALALVVIVPFLPGPQRVPIPALEEAHPGPEPRHHGAGAGPAGHPPNTLDQFEHQLKLFVALGLFFFAFANAGVAFGSINAVTFIVLASLIAGKTLGVSSFSWAATKLGFPLPDGMGMRHLVVAGMVAGLGLTVALFVAGKAFTGPPFQDPAKMGAVLSAGVALLALTAAAVLKVKDGARARAKRP
ncbi:MAG: Na+/H+ antiporter NhaA [Dehalococcoidia bacterium]|nr:Na+/H+ antiporter NhaA [Dehalococcoidia bacterium]